MNIIESFDAKMAMANLDIALDQLSDLLDNKQFPSPERDAKWAESCCAYSRFVHWNVWRDNVPPDIVQDKIVKIIAKAERNVFQLENDKSRHFSPNEKNRIKHARENIGLRKTNLADNYIKGEPSGFPVDALEPYCKS